MRALLLLALLLTSHVAWAMRCGTQLASEGDTQADIHRICGEPLVRHQQQITHRAELGPNLRERYIDEEVWLYAPGRNDFVRILTFRDGRLVREEHGDYARHYTRDRRACEGRSGAARTGMWTVEVELLCGRPDRKRLAERRRQPYAQGGTMALTREVVIEEWRYDFPEKGRVAVLIFDNGRLRWQDWRDGDDDR